MRLVANYGATRTGLSPVLVSRRGIATARQDKTCPPSDEQPSFIGTTQASHGEDAIAKRFQALGEHTNTLLDNRHHGMAR